MSVILSALGLDAKAKYWSAVAAATLHAEAQQRIGEQVKPGELSAAVPLDYRNRHERRKAAAEARHRKRGSSR